MLKQPTEEQQKLYRDIAQKIVTSLEKRFPGNTIQSTNDILNCIMVCLVGISQHFNGKEGKEYFIKQMTECLRQNLFEEENQDDHL